MRFKRFDLCWDDRHSEMHLSRTESFIAHAY